MTITGRAVLAPMAGVTDIVFRRLCRRFGAAIVYSEFLSTDGLVLNTMNQEHKLILADDEHPVAYQLFGSKTQTFGQAARQLAEYRPDMIDLNFGCPVKKVVRSNGGASCLRDLDLMQGIVAETCRAVNLPVTVKMRAGWDHETLVYQDAARLSVEAGAKAITLHARTRADAYETKARWEYITDLKPHLTVPLIGNGDVDSPEAALAMLRETGCDAVMVGRAALGRPWIFAEINHHIETGEMLPAPRVEDRVCVAWGHLQEKIAHGPDELGAIQLMRKQMAAYFRGMPGAAQMRGALMTCDTASGIRCLFTSYLNEYPQTQFSDGDNWIERFVPLDRGWLTARAVFALG